MVFLLLLSF